MNSRDSLGAFLTPGGVTFRLWTTLPGDAAVVVDGARHVLNDLGGGVHELTVPGAGPGSRYHYLLGGAVVQDPYARWFPQGVKHDAEVVSLSHAWQHPFGGLPLHRCVLYELHVGSFTPQGTYRAAQEKLPYLKDLGVTAIELMPLSAFAGHHGWGYDGVRPFAPHPAYGTPAELMSFIDAAHGLGLAVLLDAVYNHFGPDGNTLGHFASSYFSSNTTPWGVGLEYGHPRLRRLILESARLWLETYRFDGLRLDATHAIADESVPHLLSDLSDLAASLEGHKLLIAEDHRNLPELVSETGLDAIWVDDFHHVLRVTLAGDRDGYYAPYPGGAAAIARVIRRGWLFEGEPLHAQSIDPLPLDALPPGKRPLETGPSRRGRPADALRAEQFVYFIQNHDQIGNRPQGDRLNTHPDVSPAAYRGAACLLLTLPMTPLLFQGQEWGARTPFQFFSDHAGELGRLVTEGRRAEFGETGDFGVAPDPQDPATFAASRLDWSELGDPEARRTLALYRRLLQLRQHDPVLRDPRRDELRAGHDGELLWVSRRDHHGLRVLLWNLGEARERAGLSLPTPLPGEVLLHSEGHPNPAVLGSGEALLLGEPAQQPQGAPA